MGFMLIAAPGFPSHSGLLQAQGLNQVPPWVRAPKTLSLKPGQLLRGSQHVCNMNVSLERNTRGSRLFSTDHHCMTRVMDDDVLLNDYFHNTGVSPLLLHSFPMGTHQCRGSGARFVLGKSTNVPGHCCDFLPLAMTHQPTDSRAASYCHRPIFSPVQLMLSLSYSFTLDSSLTINISKLLRHQYSVLVCPTHLLIILYAI